MVFQGCIIGLFMKFVMHEDHLINETNIDELLSLIYAVSTPIFLAETFLFKQYKTSRHSASLILFGPVTLTLNCLLTVIAFYFQVNPVMPESYVYTGANIVVIALLVNINDTSGIEDTIFHLKKNKKICAQLTMCGLINQMLSVVFSRGFSEIVRNKENGDIGAWFLRPTMVIVNTILLGFIPAVICCLITKYYESLRSNAIHEILFVVFFGFIFVSLSGLQIIPNSITISLLMFGTIQSYYTRYNLSNFAQEKITAVFCMFSQLCKISLFLFGGVSFVFCFQHDVLLVVSLILGVNIVVRAITMLFVIFLGK